MARYNTFKYSEQKYGESTDDNLHWGLIVDWNEDGYFDGVNEAFERMRGISVERGRSRFLGANEFGGFDRMRPGRVTIILDNQDDRFNPFNTSSPLYPYIGKGKMAFLKVKDNTTLTVYPVIGGIITDIRPADRGLDQMIAIDIEDGRILLEGNTIDIELQSDVTTADALAQTLAAANWPAIWGTDIGASADTIPYWWEDSRSPNVVIDDLAESELGIGYINASGTYVFRSRHDLPSPVITLDQSELLNEVGLAMPWENYRDKVRIRVTPRVVQSAAELWRLQEVVLVGNGQTLTIWPEFTYSGRDVPISNPLFAASTDYTMNTQADGLGSDVTANFAVTLKPFGERGKITATNNSGGDAYVTLMKVRGDAVDAPDAVTVQGGSGENVFKMDLKYQQDVNFAQSLADFLADFLSGSEPFPIVKLKGRPDKQFGIDIFETATLTIAKKGINQDFRLGQMFHKSIDEKCQVFETTFRFEPFPDLSGYWQFTTLIGETSIFGV